MSTLIIGQDLFGEVYLLEQRRDAILLAYKTSPYQDELKAELSEIESALQKHYSFMSDRMWSDYAY